MSRIYFRADGDSKIGLGHVVRSLALVEMLKEDFDCQFISVNLPKSLRTQIVEVCELIDCPIFEDIKEEAIFLTENIFTEKDIIVLDGYHFKTEYHQILKNRGCIIVCIDDIHAYHFIADLIINHAGGISSQQYSAEPYTNFCLGLEYALLRKPFQEIARNKSYVNQSNESIFICMGGADPNNDILDVLKECETASNVESCFLIIGSAYNHKIQLEEYIKNTTLNIKLLNDLSAEELVFYMKKCGMAITAPSTISYEYLSVGGLLFLYQTADNQADIKSYLEREELAFDFKTEFRNRNLLNSLGIIEKQNRYFDGNQHKRFNQLFYYLKLSYRLAEKNDCELYYKWYNDLLTRLQSFSSALVSFDNHKIWFEKNILSDNVRMYVIMENKKAIGQIRFNINDNEALISYSLDKNYRGRGYGKLILKKGLLAIKEEFADELTIIGYVKNENIPSIKAFRELGFEEYQEESLKFVL